jgi:hypothetical protein
VQKHFEQAMVEYETELALNPLSEYGLSQLARAKLQERTLIAGLRKGGLPEYRSMLSGDLTSGLGLIRHVSFWHEAAINPASWLVRIRMAADRSPIVGKSNAPGSAGRTGRPRRPWPVRLGVR